MKKVFLSLNFAIIFAIAIFTMPVHAINNDFTATNEYNNILKTVGLIRRCDLSASASEKILYINGSTLTNAVMQKIGFKNIIVQYSSDGQNWYEERNIGDIMKSDSNNYYLNNYSVSVNGGFYYRITCTHYAKEKGLFGKSQSEDNISNSIWIS